MSAVYYKNHDGSAYVCILPEGDYMEVRLLQRSYQISFGRNTAIKAMCEDVYVKSTEDEFKKHFAKKAAMMGQMFDSINN